MLRDVLWGGFVTRDIVSHVGVMSRFTLRLKVIPSHIRVHLNRALVMGLTDGLKYGFLLGWSMWRQSGMASEPNWGVWEVVRQSVRLCGIIGISYSNLISTIGADDSKAI